MAWTGTLSTVTAVTDAASVAPTIVLVCPSIVRYRTHGQ